jgi:uncharacterized protein YegL
VNFKILFIFRSPHKSKKITAKLIIHAKHSTFQVSKTSENLTNFKSLKGLELKTLFIIKLSAFLKNSSQLQQTTLQNGALS